jgi:hypothetical protein
MPLPHVGKRDSTHHTMGGDASKSCLRGSPVHGINTAASKAWRTENPHRGIYIEECVSKITGKM